MILCSFDKVFNIILFSIQYYNQKADSFPLSGPLLSLPVLYGLGNSSLFLSYIREFVFNKNWRLFMEGEIPSKPDRVF